MMSTIQRSTESGAVVRLPDFPFITLKGGPESRRIMAE